MNVYDLSPYETLIEKVVDYSLLIRSHSGFTIGKFKFETAWFTTPGHVHEIEIGLCGKKLFLFNTCEQLLFYRQSAYGKRELSINDVRAFMLKEVRISLELAIQAEKARQWHAAVEQKAYEALIAEVLC